METFSAFLALCAGNSPVTGEFPSQRPVTRNFDIFFDLGLNKRSSKQSRRPWFETPTRSLWRHCNYHYSIEIVFYCLFLRLYHDVSLRPSAAYLPVIPLFANSMKWNVGCSTPTYYLSFELWLLSFGHQEWIAVEFNQYTNVLYTNSQWKFDLPHNRHVGPGLNVVSSQFTCIRWKSRYCLHS